MLWAYEPLAFNGQGRAAIAIGNPDEAEDIALVAPGAGSSVAGGWLSGGHNAAINLYDQSVAAQPDVDTSVIAWMGYDAPDGFDDQRIGAPWLAREGGVRLAHDVNGLWATHTGATPLERDDRAESRNTRQLVVDVDVGHADQASVDALRNPNNQATNDVTYNHATRIAMQVTKVFNADAHDACQVAATAHTC